MKAFVAEPFTVPSGSMNPTLVEGDRILVEKLSYLLGEPRRGEVVVFDGTESFDYPGESNFYVKRVVGLPGDTVECCDSRGRLLVNGSPVEEGYLPQQGVTDPFTKVTVPLGYVFVLGDNRRDSSDSRVRGPVPLEAVVGHVFAKVGPWERVDDVPRS